MLKIIGICGSVSETVTCCAQLGVQSRRAPHHLVLPSTAKQRPLSLPPARPPCIHVAPHRDKEPQTVQSLDHPFRGGKPPFRPSIGNPWKPFLVRPTGLIVVSLLFPQLQPFLLTSMAHQKRNAHCVQLDSQQPVKTGLSLTSFCQRGASNDPSPFHSPRHAFHFDMGLPVQTSSLSLHFFLSDPAGNLSHSP